MNKNIISITKGELVSELITLSKGRDVEDNHIKADKLLLEYINDEAVTDAFNNLKRWYA